jgi:hypothetical protein
VKNVAAASMVSQASRTGTGTPIRVLHCPLNVGGHPGTLAQAERAVGVRSHSVSFEQSPFGYPIDEVLWDARDGLVKRERLRFALLLRALRHFDVLHFNFGHSIMPLILTPEPESVGVLAHLHRTAARAYTRVLALRDLPLLKRFGKTLVVTYQGDDARQGDWIRAHFDISTADGVGARYYTVDSDSHKRAAIARFSRYADRIYALNPDLLHVLPRCAEFVPYAHVDPRYWVSHRPAGTNADLVVAHAPTHRGVKGTDLIIDACVSLQREGIRFELDVVEGVSQAEARTRYERADLIVDQLLAGWYGGLAVEAMALGRPTISYLREPDLHFIPAEMRAELPIIPATPTTIRHVLRDWLTGQRDALAEVGRRSRQFVERWHDPMSIAGRLKADYEHLRRDRHGVRG